MQKGAGGLPFCVLTRGFAARGEAVRRGALRFLIVPLPLSMFGFTISFSHEIKLNNFSRVMG